MKIRRFSIGNDKRKGVGPRVRKLCCALISAFPCLFFVPQAMAAGTPAGTGITNQAYADYKDANGNDLPRVFSNTVTTVVSQVPAVALAPLTATKTGAQGTNVVFPVEVENTGNGADTFGLAALSTCGGTVVIYADLDGDGLLDAGVEDVPGNVVSSTESLPADGSFKILLVVAIPAGTANGTSCNATLTGTSQFDAGVTTTGTYTVIVQDAVLSVTKSYSPSTNIKPGDVVTFAIQGNNTGSATAEGVVVTDSIPVNTTYVPGSIRIGPVGGTYATASVKKDGVNDETTGLPDPDYNVRNPGKITVPWGDAAAGDSGIIYFQVQVNANVAAGTAISNVADVNYSVAGVPQPTFQSTTVIFYVANFASILLSPDRTGAGNPGDQKVYGFTVTNNGNAGDTIDLTYTSSSGWTWVIWKDVDGNGVPGTDGDAILTDTDGDAKIDTGILARGASVALLAVATIPAGTADGTTDTTVITGASSIDPAATDPENLTTTVTAPVLSVTKSVSPTGNQPPGTELTYTVTVTNNGTGVATAVVITDIIPTFTTYKPGSIKTGAGLDSLTVRSDARDGDGGEYDNGSNAVIVPDGGTLSLGAGGKEVVQFTVTID